MQISLTSQQEKCIQSLIDSGDYTSTGEVMRHAIRLLQEDVEARRAKHALLQEAIQKGISEIERGDISKKTVNDIIIVAKSQVVNRQKT